VTDDGVSLARDDTGADDGQTTAALGRQALYALVDALPDELLPEAAKALADLWLSST
jgi:hypothetical protein